MEIEFDCEQELGNGKRKLNFHKGVPYLSQREGERAPVNCMVYTFRSHLLLYFEDEYPI